MKNFRVDAFIGLLLLCFRAAADSAPTQLPAEIIMNPAAGRGGWLIVKLRLESGEELPCMVDTGTPITLLDKSLAQKFGKSPAAIRSWGIGGAQERPATMAFSSMWGTQESDILEAPALYLGNIPLKTDRYVGTYQFKKIPVLSRRGIRGILGMDCLRHYCIQLDFEAGKMRFLDSERLNTAALGKAFPMVFSTEGQHFDDMFSRAHQNQSTLFIHHTGLLGGSNTNLLIDTGDVGDGGVEPGVITGHYLTRLVHFFIPFRNLRWDKCVWEGETYRRLRIGSGKSALHNRLGLRFLARHLVTFDFPNKTMYLRMTGSGPLKPAR